MHIGNHEGIYYLGHAHCSTNDPFSDEEHQELRDLVGEATVEI